MSIRTILRVLCICFALLLQGTRIGLLKVEVEIAVIDDKIAALRREEEAEDRKE